ncbi:SIR2 family protein [Ancylomarina sp. 16SWW S1-10-2]|uniref:SIR2 family NAD-dependent protein deacylase n=1 Tax=Ancylomarina sp. 16SWW S1-10-2 TaxID=2499681 RepID=UPI0012AE73E9|nr:SIR2 family protein [Ancylomarina sp. 16SWW S1-10-2]MRT93956.1 hypothetical protein [Ancylomarina sp. 16SWW S1-10-2]
MKDQIPAEILPYFLEIAKKLQSKHATIMVGAGFSKNAKKVCSSGKEFPNWNQLGDAFYKKLNGDFPKEKDRYLNPLKLADEVKAVFGRNILDDLLKDEIPDKEYQSSDLHEKLLTLPWRDIFTTNYDTLLERAAENVFEQRFDIVLNKEDLIHSTQPRIIKLHGSFPSERPFIITEEDYRRYPIDCAPFVNTVQQSLLENTLCMIGFSGEDPNFLKWIGWIRDNLGEENSPKIYLIGILNLTVAQRTLLEKRNIIPLDLSKCKNVDGDHKKAINLFLDFMKTKVVSDENREWAKRSEYYRFDKNKEVAPQIKSILDKWIPTREKYPNWIIVPESNRRFLKQATDSASNYLTQLSKVESPLDINFLYEYNWRIEKYLRPIENSLIEYYALIVNKYNPYPQNLKIENSITPISNDNLDWDIIGFQWLEIQLSMLRFYREEGFHKEWLLIKDRLEKLEYDLDPGFYARYHYERCLKSLFALDIKQVRDELELWEENESSPYLEAKRAGLLAEIGDLIVAEKILERSLKTVRGRLNLSPTVSDYSDVSQEAYIMQLLHFVRESVFVINRDFQSIDKNKNIYTDRWDQLIKYGCDVWNELKLFELRLGKDSNIKSTEKKYKFDSTSTTHHSGENTTLIHAYSYLRYVEEVGIPYKLPHITMGKDAAEKAIYHVANYSPYWAFASFIRMGDDKHVDYVYSKKTVTLMNRDSIDERILEYLTVLNKSVEEINNGDTYRNINFAISLSTILPEIISMLCVKCSYEVKIKLIQFLKEVFNSEIKEKYKGIGNLTRRLIQSFSMEEQYSIIPQLLEFPILAELNANIDDDYQHPFQFLNINEKNVAKYEIVQVDCEVVDELLILAEKDSRERQVSIMCLTQLWGCNLLDDKQTKKLGDALWRITDNNSFPKNTNYRYFSFITLPHPEDINPKELLRKYILNTDFPIQANKTNGGISMTGGSGFQFQVIKEIIGTSRDSVDYTWSSEDLNKVIDKSVEWWDLDKKYLLIKESHSIFGSTPKEFKDRFINLVFLFSNIFGPHYHMIGDSQKKELIRIIGEFEKHGILYDEALASCYNLLPEKQDMIYSNIYENLFSKTDDEVIYSIRGVIELLKLNTDSVQKFVLVASEQLRCRTEIGLSKYIDLLSIVSKEYFEYLSSEILNNIRIGLVHLMLETNIDEYDSDEDVSKKYDNRVAVAKLVVALDKYYKDNGIEIPTYIVDWKDICLNENEFSEIRNVLIN